MALVRCNTYRSTIVRCALLLLVLGIAGTATAQKRSNGFPRLSPNSTLSQTVGVTNVTITFGRPSVKGRKVFGELEPYGNVWRTGANEATTIAFASDVTIEGQKLAAGTYGLFSIPGESEWTIIFNKVANQWGAFSYDEKEDVLRVKVKPEKNAFQEEFTFGFENVGFNTATAYFAWADVKVPFKIETSTEDLVRYIIDTTGQDRKDWKFYYGYAFSSMYNKMMLKDGLSWIEKSISLNENNYNMEVYANIEAELGNYKKAVELGKRAVELTSAKDKEAGSLADLEKKIPEWEAKI